MNKLTSYLMSGLMLAGALMTGIGAAAADPIRIGIANFGELAQLNAAISGFKKALTDAGYVEGKDVLYSESHTNFDPSLVPQLISKLQAEKPQLIYTVTTPVSQIAKKALAGSGIPIVFSAVTDPVAAGLVPSWDSGDEDMTGASDLQNLAAVMAFTRKLLPEAKKIALPYNPGEANDVALLEKFTEAANEAGFEVVPLGVDNVNDIQQRITSLAGKADVVYTPSSNLLQPAITAVSAAARQIGIPIVDSNDGAVRRRIVPVALAVNFDKVGENAGRAAVKIMKGADPKTIPPTRPALDEHIPLISKSTMAAFGIEIPESFADCNCIIE